MSNDLRPALYLAAENLLNCFNKDNHDLPYFRLMVDDTYHAQLYFWWPAHNLGRWWDAMLWMERSLDYEIPPETETFMLRNFKWFFENEDHWCIQPDGVEEQVFPLELHSMREVLLALCGLIRYRGSRWARRAAHEMLETIDRAAKEDCSWDLEQFAYYRKHPLMPYLTFDPTGTNGRLIEALVVYYELTGDQLAFRMAERFAEWHYEHSTNPDGTITGITNMCHTHSYLGMLRGLFLFGKLTGQRRFIDRVLLSYKNTVCRIVKESGYASHDIGFEKQPETTSPGDAAQLALWLALDGHPELLDDAERIVRARILPSQIVSTPKLTPAGEGDGDLYHDLDRRILGGFGGMQTMIHAGKSSTVDVTAADVHTLLDIYDHIVVETPVMTRVFFHFDYESDTVTVRSRREGNTATLQVDSCSGKLLEIRVPAWAPRNSMTLIVNGQAQTPCVKDGFVRVTPNGEAVTVVLTYTLPEKTITERTDGVDFRIAFRGDEIVGIAPNTTFYPFYPDLKE